MDEFGGPCAISKSSTSAVIKKRERLEPWKGYLVPSGFPERKKV